MFMRYNTDPARLLRLFRAFYGQALRLRVHRRLYGILLLAALIAFAIGTFAHIDALGEDGHAISRPLRFLFPGRRSLLDLELGNLRRLQPLSLRTVRIRGKSGSDHRSSAFQRPEPVAIDRYLG